MRRLSPCAVGVLCAAAACARGVCSRVRAGRCSALLPGRIGVWSRKRCAQEQLAAH